MAATLPVTNAAKSDILRAPEFDSTFALLRDGYEYIAKRRARLERDIFRTRLMLRDVICMGGADAAKFFYDGDRFTRKGTAMPGRVVKLLQDKGSVQMLDGLAHRRRKAMFMSLMGSSSILRLIEQFEQFWQLEAASWPQRQPICLFGEVNRIICRTVCAWTGAPLPSAEVGETTRKLSAMIENVAVFGPSYWRTRWWRRQIESWAASLIADARTGRIVLDETMPLMRVAQHEDLDGRPLTQDEAAVELLNLLRPTVAVGHFIVFAAHALHSFPEAAQRLDPNSNQALEAFAQEVRRFYPFFPFIGGLARETTSFQGITIPQGQWVLLDLYGINHDPALWRDPDRFEPERFRTWNDDPYRLVPQGAGDVFSGHRCPGERITLELTKKAISLLLQMRYRVPAQDLTIRLNRMPTLPDSGFIIDNVSI